MTTEELIEEMRPLSLELEYADEVREATASTERVADEAAQVETEEQAEHHTKKELILGLRRLDPLALQRLVGVVELERQRLHLLKNLFGRHRL